VIESPSGRPERPPQAEGLPHCGVFITIGGLQAHPDGIGLKPAPHMPSARSYCLAEYNRIMIEYADASPEMRTVYDDIMATRQTDWINNFWKALAHDPATLRRTWESIKQIMGPGGSIR
jgi:hypothetical protein